MPSILNSLPERLVGIFNYASKTILLHINKLGEIRDQEMSEIDKEIILILKDLFRNKSDEFIDPDDLLREIIVKWSIYLSLFSLAALLPLRLIGEGSDGTANSVISINCAIAFTLLFIHINNKSKNPSIIMFGLTWLSLMVSLYFVN